MEMRDVVDEHDNVVGQMSKEELRKQGLLGRTVMALVFQSEKVLVQRRAEGKRWEGKWEFPVGAVRAGEPLEEAIRREVLEECFHEREPPHLEFTELFKVQNEMDGSRRFVTVFKTHFDGELSPNPREVSAVRWLTLPELVREVEEDNTKFSESCHMILHEFLKRYAK